MRKELDNIKIKEFYENGMKLQKIASMFGCSRQTIYHRLEESKAKFRRKNRPNINEKEIIILYQSGSSLKDIGRKFNCSPFLIKERLIRQNIPIRGIKEAIKLCALQGKHISNWKGGRKKKNGYLYIMKKEYPRSDRQGYVAEHILVWEKAHNRTLPNGYIIHHLNGIRDDNRIENLIALTSKQHHKLRIPYQKRIRELEKEIAKFKQGDLFYEQKQN